VGLKLKGPEEYHQVRCQLGVTSDFVLRHQQQTRQDHNHLEVRRQCRSYFLGSTMQTSFVHSRHFSSLPSDQRTSCLPASFSDAFHNLRCRCNVKDTASIIVQKIQRLSALHEQIIYRHGYKINAYLWWRLKFLQVVPLEQLTYKVVDAELHCDSQLSADSVSTTHEHWVFVSSRFEIEYATETSDFPIGTWPARRPYVWFNSFNERVTVINRDARLGVSEALGNALSSSGQCTA